MNEWKHLSNLMEKGYPLVTCLELLGKDTAEVTARLEKGEVFQDILLSNQQGSFYDHLRFFLSLTSLSMAVKASMQMYEFFETWKKKCKKQCSYPIFIFIFSYFTMIFFIIFIIPQLLQSFGTESMSILFQFLFLFVKVYCVVIAFLIITIILVFMNTKYFRQEKMMLKIYKIRWVQDYIVYILSGYLRELDLQGISTKQAFQFLLQLKEPFLLHHVIQHIDQELLQGKELLEIIHANDIFHQNFCLCFRIGQKTGTLSEALLEFMQLQEQNWLQGLKKINIFVQCIAYSFVAIMVILVYQVMLLPLQMLEMM